MKKLLIILLVIPFLFACGSDDDPNPGETSVLPEFHEYTLKSKVTSDDSSFDIRLYDDGKHLALAKFEGEINVKSLKVFE